MNSPKSLKSLFKKGLKAMQNKGFKQIVISVIRVLVKVGVKIILLSNPKKKQKTEKARSPKSP